MFRPNFKESLADEIKKLKLNPLQKLKTDILLSCPSFLVGNQDRLRQLILLNSRELAEKLNNNDPFYDNAPVQSDFAGINEPCIPLFITHGTNAVVPLPISRLPCHIHLTAPSGRGKTHFLKHTILRLAGKVNMLVFDRKKELRHIANLVPGGFIRVWRWFELKLSFRKLVKGQRVALERNETVQQLGLNYGLQASKRLAIDTLTRLDEKFGVRDFDSEQDLPTLEEWLKYVENFSAKGNASNYKEVLAFTLRSILDSTGDLFDCSYSEFYEALFEPGTVNIIEIDGLPSEHSSFLMLKLLRFIYDKRLCDNDLETVDKPITLFVLDDALDLIGTAHDNASSSGIGPISNVMLTSRSLNIGICTIGQNIYSTSKIITGNSETFVSFGAWTEQDIKELKSILSLTTDQIELLKVLPIGFLIGKVRSVWPHAILGYLPELKTHGFLDEIARKQMMEPIIKNIKWRKSSDRVEKQSEQRDEVTTEEKSFLFEIYNHPFTQITEKYKSLDLSASAGTRIVHSLEKKGLVRKHNLPLGYRGGLATFLSLNEEAFKIIKLEPKPERTVGGGFVHQCCCYLAKQKLEGMGNDWKVNVEKIIRGKCADILIELPSGEYITLEIANLTSVEHEKDNILKNLSIIGSSFNITALVQEQHREQLKRLVAMQGKEVEKKTIVCLFSEFMRVKKLSDLAKSDFLLKNNL